MRLERRSVFGWGATAAAPASAHLGLVVHYDGSDQGLAAKQHAACREYWRNTRAFHVGPQRGWLDIGYSFGACPHGYVLEGRGARRTQAAQPGGNTTWTSVTLMGGPNDPVGSAQVEAVRELRAWLRAEHGLSTGVRGHRDFVSTSCPGTTAYRLVQDGTFAGAPGGSNPGEDDMPERDRFTWNDQSPVGLRRGEWVQMRYGALGGSGSGAPHYSLAGVSSRPMLYQIAAGWRITGLEPGAEYQSRLALYDPPSSSGQSWQRARALRTQEHKHGVGDAFNVHVDQGRVGADQRVRLELLVHTDSPDAQVVNGSCDTFYWLQ